MSVQSNPISVRRFRPALLVQNEDNVLTATFVDMAGDTVSISSGTVTVYDQSGNSVSTGSASVSSNVATYTVSAAETTSQTRGRGWKVVWKMDTVEVRERAALITTDMFCPITSQDLLDEEPVLYDLEHEDDTGVDVEWSTFLYSAYKRFYSRLMNVERWPWLVMSPEAFRTYLIYDALAGIFRSLATGATTSYTEKADKYQSLADENWKTLRFDYDASDNGNISTSEQGKSGVPVYYLGSPPESYWRTR